MSSRRPLLLMVIVMGSACASSLPSPTVDVTTTAAPPILATATTAAAAPTSNTTPDPGIRLMPGDSLVVHSARELTVFEDPSEESQARTFPATTFLGTPQVYLAEDLPVAGWVRLSLPGRPNGAEGWARVEDLRFEVVDQLIRVDLSERTLVFIDDGQNVMETAVAIGSAANPTPTGVFYVTDIIQLADPKSPWGPYALGISARSETITEFNGGDGIIGIHGTSRPSTIGQAVSLGCVRLDNGLITQLAGLVGLGVPVEITE